MLLYSFLQAPEQVDRRQLKHKGALNPALHDYRANRLAQELQLAASQPPFTLNSPSTPALGPSQFLELLTNASNKGNLKTFSQDLNPDATKQIAVRTAYERTPTHSAGGSGEGATAAVHIKQEGGAAGQSSKYVPPSSPGRQGTCIGGSMAQLKTMERPKADHGHGTSSNGGDRGPSCTDVPDTPLTHFGKGGKPNTATAFATCTCTSSLSSSSLSGQRAASNSGEGGSHHPLLASSTMASVATKSEGQSTSGQQASAQMATGTGKNSHGHVRTKGPVTRSTTVRASSPSTCGDALLPPVVSSSPPSSTSSLPSSEKNAKSAEKPHGGGGGLSSEEARKLRQAQQKLQKEQWMKKYGQGTKRTLEMRSGGGTDDGSSSSNGDGGRQVPPPTNLDTGAGAEAMENGVLISDGKLNLVKGRRTCNMMPCFAIPVHCTLTVHVL